MFWLADVFNGSLSEQEIRRHEQWARRERAEFVHQTGSAIGHGLVNIVLAGFNGPRVLGRKYRRWSRRRGAIRELNSLSDHALRDIGLTRGDIREVVDSLLEGRQVRADRTLSVSGWRSRTATTSAISGGSGEDEDDWQKAA